MTKVKKIGVLSLAKIQALTMAAFGLILGLIYALIGFIAGVASDSFLMGAGLGMAAIIFIPVLYAGIGFVAGALGAFVYNLVAGWVGGIELELENEQL